MLLHEVLVTNFRAFETATLRLHEHGLVLVAGANNAGKTALLSAFDVIAGTALDTAALRRAGSAEPATISAMFQLTPDEQTAVLSANDQRAELVGAGAAARLQFVFQEQPGGQPEVMSMHIEWPGHGMVPMAIVGRQREGTAYGPQVIRGVLAGQDDIDPLRLIQRSAQWGGPVSLQTVIESTPELKVTWEFLNSWRSRFYHFRALRPGGPRATNLVVAEKLEPTGGNLTAVLLDMLTNRFGKLTELRKMIADIVPHIGQLEVRTSGQTMQAVFANGDVELNVKDLGTGVEQLLMTLVVGLTEAAPFTLVVEEPETNLHPAAQRGLLGLLKNWGLDRQIIAATHSPVLLDWSPGGDRLWHVIRDSSGSRVEPVRDDPSGLLATLGVRLSDVLTATRILVVEGPSDEDVLEAWFPDAFRSPAVAVLHGSGGDSARYADRLADWLLGVDKIGLRRVLYLRDRDELSAAALQKLQESGTVSVLERRELENYLLDASAITKVLTSPGSGRQDAPTEEQVAKIMLETAEGLKRRIIVNRVCNQVYPTRRLMDHRLRQRLAREGASEEVVRQSVAERLMTEEELQEQIENAWRIAEADVASRSGSELLHIASGEEILQTIFMRFAQRGYNKREDGVAIAKAMSSPPEEIGTLLEKFMRDELGTD